MRTLLAMSEEFDQQIRKPLFSVRCPIPVQHTFLLVQTMSV